MKAVIACGTRTADDRDWGDAVGGAVGSDGPGLVVIHGVCGADADDPSHRWWVAMKGIDRIAHRHANAIGARVLPMPAPWRRMGPSAGPFRNKMMLDVLLALQNCGYAVAVLAFHDDIANGSKGTRNMVQKAKFAGVPYAVYDRGGRVYDESD